MEHYKPIRDLDGAYFRVKRYDKYESICFSDLTNEEREKVGEGKSLEWWRSLALCLANCLECIGEELDIYKEVE